jgi:hypothetical protein
MGFEVDNSGLERGKPAETLLTGENLMWKTSAGYKI